MLYVDIHKKLTNFDLDVNFTCENERLALLGASGCGKSMTLKCIAGIETPDRGKIILNGRTLYDSEKKINLSPQKRKVGYLFQQYALFPNMTVEQNIRTGVRSRDKNIRSESAGKMIETFQLQGLEKKLPSQISGGQQQRVALARILVNEPEVMLLDEPFTALDSFLKWKLELELDDILKLFNKDVIYVSHNRDEVYRLCQEVCVMTDGINTPKQTLKGLFHDPDTVSAARLSGCKNISPVEIRGKRDIYFKNWDITLSTSEDIPQREKYTYAGLRSHFIEVTDGPGGNVILFNVARVVDDIFSYILMLTVNDEKDKDRMIRLDIDKEKWDSMGRPNKAYIHINEEDIMLLTD